MSAASDFLENAIVNATLRGIAFPTVTGNFIALHTANPGDTGASEIDNVTWPSYERKNVTNGIETLENSWLAPANGVTKNALQLIFPVYDGAAELTVTHFSVWDAATGGNMLVHGALSTNRTVLNGDVFVIDVQKLTVQVL